jgi:hypothetical protein
MGGQSSEIRLKIVAVALEVERPELRLGLVQEVAFGEEDLVVEPPQCLAYVYISSIVFLFGAQLDAIIRGQATGTLSGA